MTEIIDADTVWLKQNPDFERRLFTDFVHTCFTWKNTVPTPGELEYISKHWHHNKAPEDAVEEILKMRIKSLPPKNLLVKFSYAGDEHLEGLFVATQNDLNLLYGKSVFFLMPKEDTAIEYDMSLIMSDDYFDVKSSDQNLIQGLLEAFSSTTISGVNPLQYHRL